MAKKIGLPAYFPSGPLPFDGQMRAGGNVIKQLGGVGLGVAFGSQYFMYDFGPEIGTASVWNELSATPADSGGLVAATIGGQMLLVGLMAHSAGRDNTYAIRPAVYKDSIDEWMASSVPEPSALVLLALALSCIGLRGRRDGSRRRGSRRRCAA